ncbi:MAG TPA: radical SAM protein [Candidatus Limnocylindrales bacterium]|nr:radical SAM protein [Candidatus Limnocylindrales bacterium]
MTELYSKEPVLNSIVLKVTNYCNLCCDYCYRDSDKVSKPEVMALEIVDRIISSYAKLIDNRKIGPKSMYLIWHGGEPLLAGINYFYKIIEIEKKYIHEGYKIFNAVQTNGTLINEEWASFFKENNFSVGISMDGPEEIHDIHRQSKKNKSSFEIIYPNLLLLKEKKIPVSIISVITNDSVEHCQEVFDFFNELQIPSVDFIPCFLNKNEMTLSVESYSKFMIQLFDLWAASSNKDLNIRFLNDIQKKNKVLKTGKGTICVGCELIGRCGENFSIQTNGDIYLCECLSSIDRFKIGNIKEIGLSEIHKTEKFNEFKKSCNEINQECFACEVFKICKGGCLNRRLPESTDDNKDFYCDARKKIIRHVLKNE